MKIIQSCGSRSWGGLEMQTLKLASALQERGHDVRILCPIRSTLHKEAVSKGIATAPVLNPDLRSIQSIQKIKSFFQSDHIDIIHTNLSQDLWVLVPALRSAGHKATLVLTKRVASSVNKKDLLHRQLYKRVDRIFAISNYIRDNVINTCPIAPNKVHLLHNAISLDAFNSRDFNVPTLRSELELKPDRIVIGMIGRLTPKKGHKEFLQAAQLIKNKFSAVQFLIVGGASYGEEEYEHEIRQLAGKLFERDDYIFTGFRSDIPSVMSAMDILAFPSYEESFGNILLESMAMKLPIVASRAGGVPDIVIHEETGLLVPPKNASLLAEGLMQLVEDQYLRAKLAENARIRVERYFNFSDYMTKLESHYEALNRKIS